LTSEVSSPEYNSFLHTVGGDPALLPLKNGEELLEEHSNVLLLFIHTTTLLRFLWKIILSIK